MRCACCRYVPSLMRVPYDDRTMEQVTDDSLDLKPPECECHVIIATGARASCCTHRCSAATAAVQLADGHARISSRTDPKFMRWPMAVPAMSEGAPPKPNERLIDVASLELMPCVSCSRSLDLWVTVHLAFQRAPRACLLLTQRSTNPHRLAQVEDRRRPRLLRPHHRAQRARLPRAALKVPQERRAGEANRI